MCYAYTVEYINRTESHRLSRLVFVSYVTFKGLTTSTIAWWLKEALSLSGIDVDKFKAHSFHGVSVSTLITKIVRCVIF